jgi:hypothetical protein
MMKDREVADKMEGQRNRAAGWKARAAICSLASPPVAYYGIIFLMASTPPDIISPALSIAAATPVFLARFVVRRFLAGARFFAAPRLAVLRAAFFAPPRFAAFLAPARLAVLRAPFLAPARFAVLRAPF